MILTDLWLSVFDFTSSFISTLFKHIFPLFKSDYTIISSSSNQRQSLKGPIRWRHVTFGYVTCWLILLLVVCSTVSQILNVE